MSSMFTLIRFILAVLTIAAYFAKSHIPPKSLVLHPSELTEVHIYSRQNEDGEFWIRWLDASQYAWRCVFLPSDTTTLCGFVISWEPKPADCEQKPLPFCSGTASDVDGDGRGWSKIGSCRVRQASMINGEKSVGYPTCTAAVADQNNDGLSWERGRTCQLAAQIAQHQRPQSIPSDDLTPVAEGAGQPNQVVMPADRLDAQTSSSQTPTADRHNTECSDANLNYPSATLKYVDLSQFDGIKLSASYEGSASFLNMYLINRSAEGHQSYSDKFMSAFIPTLELKTGPVYLPLNDFKVELWWEMQNNPQRAHAGPEFNRIATIGIDPAEYGTHRVQVDRLELVGEHISSRTFLIAVFSIWASYLIFEIAFRYFKMRSSVSTNQIEIETLSDSAQHLRQEQLSLQTRSVTDPLTQVYNRTGAAQWLRSAFGSGPLPPNTGLMVLDIDHFKTINDTHGHEIGDSVLKEFAALTLAAVREDDLVVRWGGEEFLLLFQGLNQAQLMFIAEKLRSATAQHTFATKGIAQVTVSIGVTSTKHSESFERAFKRADEALYKAKLARDKVVYE